MRALPDIVLEAYLRPEWTTVRLLAARPWWQSHELRPHARRAWRRDGRKVEVVANGAAMPALVPPEADLEDACARYDEKHPIAFPGVRVGQIWQVGWDSVSVVVGPLRSADLFDPFEGARELLRASREDAGRGVLLVDPCRPDLAPWTGWLP